jgi:hypothetical protein
VLLIAPGIPAASQPQPGTANTTTKKWTEAGISDGLQAIDSAKAHELETLVVHY